MSDKFSKRPNQIQTEHHTFENAWVLGCLGEQQDSNREEDRIRQRERERETGTDMWSAYNL